MFTFVARLASCCTCSSSVNLSTLLRLVASRWSTLNYLATYHDLALALLAFLPNQVNKFCFLRSEAGPSFLGLCHNTRDVFGLHFL
jgi:hypothetical protein